MAFPDSAMAFLATPGPETFAALRSDVVDAPGFTPYLDLGPVLELLRDGKDAEAIAALRAMMPAAFLSPRVHALLAGAHQRLGDDTQVRSENVWEQATVAAILDGGAGTEASPWPVLMVSDEYDVLRALGRTSVEQRLIQVGSRPIDFHACTDGSTAFFDVVPLADLAES